MSRRRDAAGLPGDRQQRRGRRAAARRAGPSCGARSAALALHLKAQGVEPGDRVAAYLPNIPETIIAFLASASIGAVWSVCAPDMAAPAVLDRFRQIEPKVLIACDGVTYAGAPARPQRRASRELRRSLPTRRACASCTATRPRPQRRTPLLADDPRQRTGAAIDAFEPRVAAVRPSALDRLFQRHHRPAEADRARPWRHHHRGAGAAGPAQRHRLQLPRRTRSASATTGTARPAGSCGTRRSAACSAAPPSASSTAAPAAPRTSPTGPRCGASSREPSATFFGAGAAFFANCMKAGIDLARAGDLSRAARARLDRLAARRRTQALVQRRFAARRRSRQQAQADIWWANISGGTDFAGAFIGGNRELPQTPGEMQCRCSAPRSRPRASRAAPVDRRGRRTRLHRADAVDAAATSGTTRATRATAPAISRSIRTISTAPAAAGLAPRRLAQDHAGRRLHHLRPQRRDHQPPRPAHGHQRALPRGRGAAGGAGLAWSSTSNTSAAKATCRCSWCCARASRSTTRCRRRINKAIEAGAVARASCPNEIFAGRRDPAHAVGQEAGAADQEAAARPAASRRSSTATRWPIPAASTGISPSPATISPNRGVASINRRRNWRDRDSCSPTAGSAATREICTSRAGPARPRADGRRRDGAGGHDAPARQPPTRMLQSGGPKPG